MRVCPSLSDANLASDLSFHVLIVVTSCLLTSSQFRLQVSCWKVTFQHLLFVFCLEGRLALEL